MIFLFEINYWNYLYKRKEIFLRHVFPKFNEKLIILGN